MANIAKERYLEIDKLLEQRILLLFKQRKIRLSPEIKSRFGKSKDISNPLHMSPISEIPYIKELVASSKDDELMQLYSLSTGYKAQVEYERDYYRHEALRSEISERIY